VCLPLLIFLCTIKSRSSLLALAHPGGLGKRAVERMCVCVCVSKSVVCVCQAPAPGPYVREMIDAGMFFSNRVLKDFKEKYVTCA